MALLSALPRFDPALGKRTIRKLPTMPTSPLIDARPMPWMAAFLGAGVCCATRFPIAITVCLIASVGLALGTLLLPRLRLVLVLGLVFAIGAVRTLAERPLAPLPSEHVVLAGTVVSPPRERQGRWSWQLESGGRRFQVFQRTGPGPRWGDTVRLRGECEFPESPTNPGQFDYKAWLGNQGIVQIVRIRHAPDRVGGPASLWTVAVRALRERVAESCRRRLPTERQGLAAGMLLSITDDIPFEMREAFESTGTVHLLSTSGFHLATLGSAVGVLLSFAGPWARSSITVALVWIVAIASGGTAAPVRSACMATLASAAPLLGRRGDSWNILATAAFVAILTTPGVVFDVGAQLSFATVGVLLLISPAVRIGFDIGNPWRTGWRLWLANTGAALAVSAAATAASAPLVAHHLYRFQPWAPVVNVPATLLGGSILVNGAAAVLLDSIPGIGTLGWFLFDVQLRLLQALVLGASRLPGADVAVAPPGALPTACCVVGILGSAAWLSRRLEQAERCAH